MADPIPVTLFSGPSLDPLHTVIHRTLETKSFLPDDARRKESREFTYDKLQNLVSNASCTLISGPPDNPSGCSIATLNRDVLEVNWIGAPEPQDTKSLHSTLSALLSELEKEAIIHRAHKIHLIIPAKNEPLAHALLEHNYRKTAPLINHFHKTDYFNWEKFI